MKTILFITIAVLMLSCAPVNNPPSLQSNSLPQYLTKETALEKISLGAMVIDVRTKEEFKNGHLPLAINIPHDQMESRLSELSNNQDKEIILYCGSGRRAGLAQDVLLKHGFKQVYNAGGYDELK